MVFADPGVQERIRGYHRRQQTGMVGKATRPRRLPSAWVSPLPCLALSEAGRYVATWMLLATLGIAVTVLRA